MTIYDTSSRSWRHITQKDATLFVFSRPHTSSVTSLSFLTLDNLTVRVVLLVAMFFLSSWVWVNDLEVDLLEYIQKVNDRTMLCFVDDSFNKYNIQTIL